MFIPIRTDRSPKRQPVVTETLIAVNLVAWMVAMLGTYAGLFDNPEAIAAWGHFDPQHFRVWQLFTYQFIHDPHDVFHVVFNMLFLWVFGRAVEGRLGAGGFLAFYLVGGAVSGLAHSAVSLAPVIGASGAVAAVTGAFLALFPRSRVITFIWFAGLVPIPSLWFIGIYVVVDLLRQLTDWIAPGGAGVAYMAHLAGYAYGFGVALGLLALRVLPREEFDVFFLFTQARRRAAFRSAGRGAPAGLWADSQADTGRRLHREKARRAHDVPPDPATTALRSQINQHLERGKMHDAATAYRRLLEHVGDTPAAILTEQRQLDVAAQLYAEGVDQDAARAYELLLASYPNCPRPGEVKLILGLLYARRLGKPERARELIEQAGEQLHDEGQAALARRLLAELPPGDGGRGASGGGSRG